MLHLSMRNRRDRSRRAFPQRRSYGIEGLEPRTLLSVQPIGPEFVVNTRTVSDQTTLPEHHAVAMDAAGNFVVIWESSEGVPNYGPLLYAQRFNAAGVKQGGEIQITPPAMRGPFAADLAMDASGDFVVVWDNQTAPEGIYSQRYNADGVPQGNNFLLAPDAFGPVVAMDADGDYVVAWTGYTDFFRTTRTVFAQRFDATGAAQGGPFQANAFRSDRQNYPAVAMDAGGDFVITWEWFGWVGNDPVLRRVQARLFDSQGNPRGNEFDVTASDPHVYYIKTDVAMDANGGFAVVWDATNLNGVGFSIYGRRYSPAGTPLGGGAFMVNTSTAGDQREPSIAMDAAGDFVVTWTGPGKVMGQRFNAAGAKDDVEFRLDTRINTSASGPSVGMDYDGDFVAAWTGRQADDDIYARVFSGPQLGNLATGQVFQDLNGNSVNEPGDPGMANWVVYRDTNNNGQLESGVYSTPSVTPLTGMQPFSTRRYVGPGPGPAAGDVITDVDVTINIQHPNDSDLTATLISPAGTRAELFSHVGATGDNFTRTTFDDSNPVPIPFGVAPFTATYRTQNFTLGRFNSERLTDDGYWMLEVRNDGPNGGYVFSWVVTVSYAEDSTLTDAAGNYSLSYPAGHSNLRETPQSGWLQTLGSDSWLLTSTDDGRTFGGIDFGNAYPGVISGSVFLDVNGNGADGAGEGLLGGWTVFADLNNNGQLDAAEPSTTSTNPFGYTLRGVPLNRSVSLAVIAPDIIDAPWEMSVAPGAITLTAAQPRASQQDFGLYQRASVSGVKFNDLNRNGLLDRNEPGLAGWTIYLDQNSNGQLDGGPVSTQSGDTPLAIEPSTRPVTSDLSVEGQAGSVIDVNVTLNVSHPEVNGLVVVLISPSGNRVQLFGDLPRRSVNFTGTTFDDQAADNIADGTAPFAGRFTPLEPLALFNGEDPNGVWKLEVSNSSRSSGSLDGWSLTITTPAEPSVITSASGRFVFGPLRPGSYSVREQAQPGWIQTAPASGVYLLTVASGQDGGGLYFGNRTVDAVRIIQVYAGASTWPAAFKAYVQSNSLGSAQFGVAIGGGAAQSLALPWSTVNQISVQFDGDVQADMTDLAVRGTNVGSYAVTAFAYDPATHTATWTLGRTIPNDKIILDLDGDAPDGVHAAGGGGSLIDGDWTTGGSYPSGDGAAGGDLRFRVSVLPGDPNRDGRVNALDVAHVKQRLGTTTASRIGYGIFGDVTADGRINALDVAAVKQRLSQQLPGPAPASLFAVGRVDDPDSRASSILTT